MTAANRLAAVGANLAERAPAVVDASIALLESVVHAIDTAQSDREDTVIAPGKSDELRELLRRWLGWSTSRLGEVDRALREVQEMANGRTALILRGEGSLLGVARRLHRLTLPKRPFVVLNSDERVTDAGKRARDGMLYVEARDIPRTLAPLAALASEARVRIVVSAELSGDLGKLLTMLPQVATIRIPPIAERRDDLDQLIEAYRRDAVATLGAPDVVLRPHDLKWIRANGSRTLAEIEEVTHRLVALRAWGVTQGAARLGVSHGALSRWARRRRIPT